MRNWGGTGLMAGLDSLLVWRCQGSLLCSGSTRSILWCADWSGRILWWHQDLVCCFGRMVCFLYVQERLRLQFVGKWLGWVSMFKWHTLCVGLKARMINRTVICSWNSSPLMAIHPSSNLFAPSDSEASRGAELAPFPIHPNRAICLTILVPSFIVLVKFTIVVIRIPVALNTICSFFLWQSCWISRRNGSCCIWWLPTDEVVETRRLQRWISSWMIEIEVWNFVLYLPLVMFEDIFLEPRRRISSISGRLGLMWLSCHFCISCSSVSQPQKDSWYYLTE